MWSPHDLPFLIEKASRGYANLFGMAQSEDFPATALPQLADSLKTLLDAAPLTWFDEDMSTTVGELSRDVPDWSPDACLPGPSGVIAFEASPITIPYETATNSTVDLPLAALMWDTTSDGLIRVSGWCQSATVPAEDMIRLAANLGLEELLSVRLEPSTIVTGASELQPATAKEEARAFRQAGVALRSLAGAAWLLMSQPRMVRETDSVTARVKKRTSLGQPKRVEPVRVSITSLVAPPSPSGRGRGTGRKATTRWWVRGHWRQQPGGKDRALRKPIWIAPHTAGAADADLDSRPHVQVWRTGQDQRKEV